MDQLYLTREALYAGPEWLPPRARYANLEWPQVARLVDEVWPGSEVKDLRARAFADYLRTMLGPETEPAPAEVDDRPSLDAALSLAELVAADGQQRAYPFPWSSHEEASEFRAELGAALKHEGRVTTWVWRPASKGHPLTVDGLHTKLEVRLSPRGKTATADQQD